VIFDVRCETLSDILSVLGMHCRASSGTEGGASGTTGDGAGDVGATGPPAVGGGDNGSCVSREPLASV
jgi:hypothetical protein